MNQPSLPQQPPTRRPNARRFATARVVFALMLREMSSRYGSSALGYLWALVEPMGGVVMLAIGFSLLLRSPPIGDSFLLFYAVGYLNFNAYQSIQATTSQALNFNRPLLIYPAVTWMDSLIARFILNVLTNFVVATLLIGIILVSTGASAQINVMVLGKAMLLSSLLGLGVGSVNATLMALIPSWVQIWSIITRPLFIASCILFMFESLPPAARAILYWNPLVHTIGLMRRGMYATYEGGYINPIYVLLVALGMLLLGLVLLGRYHRDILNR